jgi:hypothetical protein
MATRGKSINLFLVDGAPTRRVFVNITPQVEDALLECGIREGLVLANAMNVMVSVFINDNERWQGRLTPERPHGSVRPQRLHGQCRRVHWVTGHVARGRHRYHGRQVRLRNVETDILRRV